MRTPYGRECKFFYGDYYRGRNVEECRALANPDDRRNWSNHYCKNCPMPGILVNNGCPNLVLSAYINRTLFKKGIQVKAYCTLTHEDVKDPNVGCGSCH